MDDHISRHCRRSWRRGEGRQKRPGEAAQRAIAAARTFDASSSALHRFGGGGHGLEDAVVAAADQPMDTAVPDPVTMRHPGAIAGRVVTIAVDADEAKAPR